MDTKLLIAFILTIVITAAATFFATKSYYSALSTSHSAITDTVYAKGDTVYLPAKIKTGHKKVQASKVFERTDSLEFSDKDYDLKIYLHQYPEIDSIAVNYILAIKPVEIFRTDTIKLTGYKIKEVEKTITKDCDLSKPALIGFAAGVVTLIIGLILN